jgi:hypothetical protein
MLLHELGPGCIELQLNPPRPPLMLALEVCVHVGFEVPVFLQSKREMLVVQTGGVAESQVVTYTGTSRTPSVSVQTPSDCQLQVNWVEVIGKRLFKPVISAQFPHP